MGARENDLNPDTWIGLSFPLGRDSQSIFRRTKTNLQQAKYNLQNLLLTMKGERIGQPNLGSNLHRLLFEPINEEEISTLVEEEILNATSTWLPYVNIIEVKVNFNNRDKNTVGVEIRFSITLNPASEEQIALTFETGDY